MVTGGAGFIGSHVVDHLLQLGHRVVVLDDLSGGFKENVNPKARFYAGSITDAGLVNEIFSRHKITFVYHLAAYAAEGLSPFIRRYNYQNNLLGSINLINAAVNHTVQCFVFTSSLAVYGGGTPPFSEDMPPNPEDPYGIAKYAVELDLHNAQRQFGLNYIIFRPHNVYGERQHIGDRYRNVVGIFMNQVLQGQPLTLFGDGRQTRAFTYIDDVAPYIATAVTNRQAFNQTFNIGSAGVYSVKELALAVGTAMGARPAITLLPPRQEVLHAYADHRKFVNLFKPQQPTDLQNGLARMAAWVKAHGSREARPFAGIEISKNLPATWQ